MNGKVKLLSSKIKELRLYRGLSQEALCQEFYEKNIQVSISTLKRAESNKNINFRIAGEIAKFFNVSIDAIIDQSNAKSLYQSIKITNSVSALAFSVLIMQKEDLAKSATSRSKMLSRAITQLNHDDFCITDIIGNYITGFCWPNSETEVLEKFLNYFDVIKHNISNCALSICIKKIQLLINEKDYKIADLDIESMIYALQRSAPDVLLIDNISRNITGGRFSYHSANIPIKNDVEYFQLSKKVSMPIPVFGRYKELQQFSGIIQEHKNKNHVFLVSVTGSPGIGKTHLGRHFVNIAQNAEYCGISIQCFSATALKRPDFISRLRSSLSDLHSNYPDSNAAQITEPNNGGMAPQQCKLETSYGEIRTTDSLAKLLRDTYISFIFIDDAHYLDETERNELFTCLLQLHKKMLVILSYDPGLYGFINTNFNFPSVQFKLDPLHPEDVQQQVNFWLPNAPDYLNDILNIARGNPQLIEDLILQSYNRTSDPISFVQIAQNRITNLPEHCKKLLRYAALYGNPISMDVMKLLINNSKDLLHYLTECHILTQIDDNYFIFSHLEFLEKAKSLIPADSLSLLHNDIVNALLSCNIKSNTERLEKVAYHLFAQNRMRDAIGYHHLAAQAGKEAGQADIEMKNLYKTLDLFDSSPDPLKEIEIRLIINSNLVTNYGWSSPPVKNNFKRISGLCTQIENPQALSSILFHRWSDALLSLKLRESLNIALEFKRHANRTQDQCAEAQALSAIGNSEYWLGNLDNCIRQNKKALTLYSSEFHTREKSDFGHDSRILATVFIALSYSLKNYPKETQEALSYLNDICKTTTHPLTRAMALQANLFVCYHDNTPCQDAGFELLQIAEEFAIPFFIGTAKLFIGWSEVLRGNIRKGSILLEEGYNLWMAKSGAQMGHSLFTCMKAETLIKTDRSDIAINVLNQAIVIALENEELVYITKLYQLKASAESHLNFHSEKIESTLNAARRFSNQQQIYRFITYDNDIPCTT